MPTGATEIEISRSEFRPAHEAAAKNARQARFAWFAAAMVAIAAAAVYIWISDWPAGTHADEDRKVWFVLTGVQDFNHPLLLLQTTRLANFFFAYDDPEALLRLGRVISSMFGGLVVFSTFVLARLVLASATAVTAAVAVAVTPLIVFHATFLKEDIFFTGPAILGLAGLLILVERPSAKAALSVGLAFGLAISAKYIAALFLIYAIAVVSIFSTGRVSSSLRNAGLVVATSVLVFCVINVPALSDLGSALAGFDREVSHASSGHDVRMPIWLTGGVMHLRESLMPGLGLPLLVLGLAGLSAPFLNLGKRKPLAIIAGAALLWYLAHEISPLKPYPNLERYVLPVGPLLVVLGAAFVEAVVGRRAARLSALAASTGVLVCAAPAAYSSYAIVDASAHDPRRVVPEVFALVGPESTFDEYTSYTFGPESQPLNRSPQPRTVVTSSFWYDRFARYGDHPSQRNWVREMRNRYFGYAFQKPYLELSTGGTSFGFLNPVVRIVVLDDDIDRLVSIGQAVIELDPHIQIDIGP